MQMAVTPKSLANGQLSDSTGDLYTCPAATQAIIQPIILVNTHSAAITCNLFVLPYGGTARRFIPKDMSLGAGCKGIEDSPLTLEAGDKIQGDASTADKVDYLINGVENA
jgi:hypothetical protein